MVMLLVMVCGVVCTGVFDSAAVDFGTPPPAGLKRSKALVVILLSHRGCC
ncbi:hypothetical protein [Candidatus Endomicrobiellum pyrsonymphae]